MALEHLEPKECFRWFEAISRIPRGSHNEKAISEWLAAFAKERGLAVIRDAHGNVCIKKPGTPGMETAPAVILQGHMDMVCVKGEGVTFDFEKDPIRLKMEGDRLTADGTTLGADNGIALAFILALLDAKDIPHPPLEAVITVEEEVGLVGAAEYDASVLTGTSFINIDSEEEGVFCVSCAGGRRSKISLPVETVDTTSLSGADRYGFFTLSIGGLTGGHSGQTIDQQRVNAAILMGRVLHALSEEHGCYLADISGGSAVNVIPSTCSATICIDCPEDMIGKELDALAKTYRHEFAASDGKGLTLQAAKTGALPQVFSRACTNKVIAMLTLIPDGVVSMDLNMEHMVESSTNLGMVRVEDGMVTFSSLSRSSVGSKKEFICAKLEKLARLTGAEIMFHGNYPAWEYSPTSRVRDVFMESYADLFGKEAKAEGIHAGLECGLFYDKFRELGRDVDFIAFGPDITGAHTVTESVSVPSVERMWRLLLEALRRLGAGK